MIRRAGPLALALLALAPLAGAPPSPARAAPPDKAPRLTPETVPATGRQTAVLTVPRFGRYAIAAESAQGVGLQLVDRMEGPGSVFGSPGERDGRVDAFLDVGDVLVVSHAADKGQGTVTLRATRSAEMNQAALRLEPERLVETTLTDHAHRSWWIDLATDRIVAFEAAGRHLADLRLWRDGNWLVDAAPSCGTLEPTSGQPLTRCTLTHRLPAGLYRLSAYGGPGAPWAEAAETRALHVRWGVPRVPGDGGRVQRTLGPLGVDRFRLDGAARELAVSVPKVPEGGSLTLAVDRYDEARPFADGGVQAAITKESRVPIARLRAPLTQENVVVVTGPPGETYTLEWFAPIGVRHVLGGQGAYYLTTLHPGEPGDRIDASALFTRGSGAQQRVVDQQSVPLRRDRRYTRRFNLTGLTTLHLDVQETGDYSVTVEGAELRIEPALDSRPEGYVVPEWSDDRLETGLPRGPHLLNLRPKANGPAAVVELAIRPALWNPLAGGPALPSPVDLPPVVQRGRIELSHADPLTLVRNSQGQDPVGVVLRPLPIDPTVPLPFTLPPGAELSVEVQAPGKGRLRALTAEGAALEVAIDGPFKDALFVDAGPATVRVQNPGEAAAVGALRLDLDRPEPAETPLPVERLGALPAFPTLSPKKSARADLDRNGEKTWRVAVRAPALYVLESTGLLHTAGVLRTRTRLDFARSDGDGVGRNFRVARYLGAGDYQLTVGARGASRGRIGVQLVATPLIDGGALRPGIPARRTVPAGRAVAYTFTVPEAGRYRLRSVGRGHTFRCRLEDAAGWPITRPEIDCDTTRAFEPGDYRVIVLPTAVETRRLTRLDPVREARRFAGHGPHPLPAREPIEHVWREPASGERTPDWWDFDLPAAGPVQIALSDEMVGELLRRDGESTTRVERVAGGRTTDLDLPAGRYRLAVRCARRNDHVPYRLTLTPAKLMAGHQRTIRPPETLPIAVGAEGLYEITSEGDIDVRARLLDAEGRSLAVADDRPDGWNFRIARRLPPGDYTLHVEALDGARGSTTVAMEAPTAVDGEPLAFDAERALVPDGATHHLPLPAPGRAPALVARLRSTQNAGVAIEAQTADGWRTLAADTGTDLWIAARPLPDAAHRLRVWSLDQRGLPVTVAAHAPTPVMPSEPEAARGLSAEPARGPAAVVALPPTLTPGVFALAGPADLMACTAAGAACVPVGERPVPVSAAGLVLVSGEGRVTARRVVAGAKAVALTVPGEAPVRLDLAEAAGPRWVEVHSPIGRPGVRLGSRAATGVGRQSAAAYATEGAAAAELTSGDGAPLDVRVRAVALDRPAREELTGGAHEAALAPGASVTLRLPAGHAPQITLDAGLAAVTGEAIVWAADGPTSASPGPVEALTILNPGEAPGRFRVVAVAGDAPAPRLTAEAPVELSTTRRGERRIDVAAADGTLRLVGAIEDAAFIDPDGRVGPAEGAATARGGTLVVQHRPGPVLAWIAPADPARRVGPWLDAGAPGFTLTGNTARPLDGRAAHAAVKLDGPAMLHLRLPAPFAAVARPAGGPPTVTLRPAGGQVDLWLPEGAGTVHLRGLAGAPLWGALEATVTRPTPIGEGPGPEILLAPGDARPFAFAVEREAAIGIGVRAAADRVEATLLAATGEVIGEGPVQMPTLRPGRYVLVLRLPPDAAPVVARPALAGVQPPSDGPPDDVVREYLRLSGRTPVVN